MKQRIYHTIGVMSGTSLDGLDMAYCIFNFIENEWKYEVVAAETLAYQQNFKDTLSSIHKTSAQSISLFDIEYGRWIGETISDFITKNNIKEIDFIASHGHTIFHQPEKRFTLQVGNGNSIAAASGCNVIYDFRKLDVALGGQGAPLVPVGDHLLFSDYTFCLNLGGFANISFVEKNKRIAFDICPVNIILNYIANKAGKDYDENGDMAASGKLNSGLLEQLNSLDFYQSDYPKSLGREWVEKNILPTLDDETFPVEELMHTCCEHIAMQISSVINQHDKNHGNVLVTGGGAFNKFLIEKLKNKTKAEIILPGKKVINYKEALIFAFLGVLRMEQKINVYAGVTGASEDSCSGVLVIRKMKDDI